MLISIIIPTRERAEYLKASLATCVAIADPDIEIVVSDNASLDHTQEVIRSFNDPRIINVNTGRRVSMRENFDFAISKSSGEYVIMIGDDDAMLPGQFSALRGILEECRPNVFSWCHLGYGWPLPGYHRRGHTRLRRDTTFGPPTVIATAPLVPSAEGTDDAGIPVPRIYHGCASRKILNRIHAKTGAYLNSRAPDLYFMLYTIFAERNFLYADHPFSISGHTPADIGGSHRYRAPDPRAQPAIRFVAEVEADPRQDAIPGPWPTLHLTRLAQLETVKRDWSDSLTIRPRYRDWYRQILAANRDSPTLLKEVVDFLGRYAKSNATEEDLGAALVDLSRTRLGGSRFMVRLKKNLRIEWPITISGWQGTANTVATVASKVDDVLGDNYSQLMKQPGDRAKLWRSARLRSLGVRA